MTLQEMLKEMTNQLVTYSELPRLEAEILMAYLLKVEKSYLFTHSKQLLSSEMVENLNALIKRRQKGEPIAYLIGSKEFWSLSLNVNSHVLIPRPETELLVELALHLLPENESLSIVDLGTGSGAIAIALAAERPHWKILAIDKSLEALEIAKNNAQELQCNNIEFIASHWYEKLPLKKYAAIISNPPYIALSDPHLENLFYEPQSALVSGEIGDEDLEKIIINAEKYLLSNGLLLLEHGYNQALNVRNKLYNAGFQKIETRKDLAGIERVTLGFW
ncbi:MAG: Release factor glutamine methyltransferase [Legionellaceae bacterium]